MTAEPAQGPSSIDNDFEIFDSLYRQLRRFAAVVADSDMDPDDLVQDALVATLRRHELSELEHPAAYLKTAIVNSAASDRRRRGLLRRLLPRLANETASHDVYPSDLGVLDALSPLDRAVIFLADVEGLNHTTIADELGLTHSAVRKRVSRARAELRTAINPNLSALPKEGS